MATKISNGTPTVITGTEKVPIGTGSGKTITTTQAIANLPANLPEVGTIVSENWANLSSWTKVGAQTFTVSGGNLSVVGGAPGSVTLSNYYIDTGYGSTSFNAYTFTCNITVGTISSSSYGVAFGLQSANSNFPTVGYQVGVMLDATNKGNIFLFSGNSNTVIAQTQKAITISAGHVLAFKLIKSYDQTIAKIINTSLSTPESVTLIFNQQDNYQPLPTGSNFAIYAMGGTHTVGALTIDCNQKIGADILVIGDSRTVGTGSSNQENNFPNSLSNFFSGTTDSYGCGRNRTQDFNASEVIKLKPRNIVILAGTNNESQGESAATAATNLNTFITSLTGYTLGDDLWYCDELPRSDADMAPYSSALKTTIGTTGCVFTYTSFLASSGTGPILSYFYSDGLHLNNYGYQQLASVVAAQLPLSKKNKVSGNISRVHYQGNGKVSVGSYQGYTLLNSLEVIDALNVSQIRFGNSTTAGGYLTSTSNNIARLSAGFYYDGTNFINSETTGSSVNLTGGNVVFQTSSGTVGGVATLTGLLQMKSTGSIITGSSFIDTYRTTNAGVDISTHLMVDPLGSVTTPVGGLSMSFDNTNGLGFNQINGTRRIQGASILPISGNSGAGTEAMALSFNTMTAGTLAQRLRIGATGNIFSGSSSNSTFRTTNAGSDVVGHFLIDPASSVTAGLAYGFEVANGFVFTQGNGTRRILGASIVPSGLTSTAGSEVMGLDFKTQAGGGAAATRMTITGAGNIIQQSETISTTSTPTAAGTTTLTSASNGIQIFTGSTTQTVTLPVVTTLTNGFSFRVVNVSSGVVTVQTSGSNSIKALAANSFIDLWVKDTTAGTGTASWNWFYNSTLNN